MNPLRLWRPKLSALLVPVAHLALLGLLLLLPLPAASQVQKERARAPQVVALQIGDRRYEALHWGKAMRLGQNGGFVTASEAGSGQVLWNWKPRWPTPTALHAAALSWTFGAWA